MDALNAPRSERRQTPKIMQVTKPARKAIKEGTQPLDVFFSPKTVAVIGATETANTVGRTILWNLVTSPFGGTVFPINPKRPSVLGVKAYKHISDVPEPVDLAVIVTPAASVPASSMTAPKKACRRPS